MAEKSAKASIAWAVAAIIIAVCITICYLVSKVTGGIGAMGSTAANALRPNVTIQQVIANTISEIRKESKLVVMTAEVTLYEKRSSEKKVLFDFLDLGTTVVELRVPGNKIQYMIPTKEITSDNFKWDEATGEVVIELPAPVVDESIVDIQSDPSKIEVRKDIGWARLESRSGAYLEEEIRKNLRALAIDEGKSNELLQSKAREKAGETVRELFAKSMKAKNVNVIVRTTSR